jgi:hypothetical protein
LRKETNKDACSKTSMERHENEGEKKQRRTMAEESERRIYIYTGDIETDSWN